MRSRFLLGIGILGLLFSLGLTGVFYFAQKNDPIAAQLVQAGETALIQDMEDAMAMVQSAKKAWDENRNTVATMTDHNAIDEIEGLFAQIQAYGKAADLSQFAACCAQLSEKIRAISEEQLCSLWNIL